MDAARKADESAICFFGFSLWRYPQPSGLPRQ